MENTNRLAIVLNGPPRAGKDTAIEVLAEVFSDADVYQFFRPIKELLHQELGLAVPYDFYEDAKDVPLPEFGGMTPRRAYIDKGDRMQAEHGHSILTDTYFAAIASSNAPILVTTCGMDSEALEIAGIFGLENTLVLRIHRDGCDFSQDSRSWVHSDHLTIRDVRNVHGRQREYQSEVAAVCRAWVEAARLSEQRVAAA
jgi:hypothetical protein